MTDLKVVLSGCLTESVHSISSLCYQSLPVVLEFLHPKQLGKDGDQNQTY